MPWDLILFTYRRFGSLLVIDGTTPAAAHAHRAAAMTMLGAETFDKLVPLMLNSQPSWGSSRSRKRRVEGMGVRSVNAVQATYVHTARRTAKRIDLCPGVPSESPFTRLHLRFLHHLQSPSHSLVGSRDPR